MDKVLSARVDQAIAEELDRMSRRLGLSKKQLLEEAILLRARSAGTISDDVWKDTCGAWRRREAPATTVRTNRREFEASMRRHHRSETRSKRRSSKS
jgi:hypothetical protein